MTHRSPSTPVLMLAMAAMLMSGQVLLMSTAQAAKKYPPIGKVAVLMAQERLRKDSFKNFDERLQATTKEAADIIGTWQKQLDEGKSAGTTSAFTHQALSQRYQKARSEIPGRAYKMLRPGGPSAGLKRFKGWVKRALGKVVAAPVRVITGDREFAARVGRVVVNLAEWKSAAGKALTRFIQEVEFTEKSVRDAVNDFNRLDRLFRRNPRLDPVSQAAVERQKCVYTCDNIRADCARRNCRKDNADEHCEKNCAGCEPRVCEQAFSPAWAAEDRGYLPCAGRYMSRYLAGLQKCVNIYIKSKSKQRLLGLADCYGGINGTFVQARDDCRERACAAKCASDNYTVIFGRCLCPSNPGAGSAETEPEGK